jgi:hypothetical protein
MTVKEYRELLERTGTQDFGNLSEEAEKRFKELTIGTLDRVYPETTKKPSVNLNKERDKQEWKRE